MTFNELFSQFQQKYDNTHDVIFFEIVFKLSKLVKTKERFVENRSIKLDFTQRRFWKLCEQYFKLEKPLAHIVGHTTFCGLDFKVENKVLAPRDVTEQMTKDFIETHAKNTGDVLDLCCGCGCIGISIKKYIPQMNVTCVDKYYGPFANTHANALKHKIAITLDQCDAITYLNRKSKLDYLISNPPYINANNFANAKKMTKWESKKALIAPDHGLYFYKEYFKWLSNHSFKEAWLEVGYDLFDQLETESKKYPDLDFNFVTKKQYLIIKKEK